MAKIKLKLCVHLCAFLLMSSVQAQMVAPKNWKNYEKVFGVQNDLRNYDFDVYPIESSCKTNVLWPGEDLTYKIQVVNRLNVPIKTQGKIDIIRYGTRGLANDIWMPEIVKLADEPSIPVTVSIAPKGFIDIQVKPTIPAIFGGYALILDLGKYGRRLISGTVRSVAANTQKLRFPKQSLDDMGPEFLSRLGVQAIRMAVEYVPTSDKNYLSKMAAIDKKLQQYHEKNITVLLVFSNGSGPMPLDMPRPFLDSSNTMRKTKADYVWMPENDTDFSKFVKQICVKQGWPAGPVTAVSLWNEPWEGSSISGWQSDIPRYREIYKAMADGVQEARKEHVEVLVGGTDSNTNAWDKLFADGKMDFLNIFDFVSIHYQGMETPALYPEWINRQSPNGRVKIWDTESWVGNTDDRIGLTVATNRSTGYDRSMGIYAGYLSTGGRGTERYEQRILTATGTKTIERIPDAWSSAVAVAAVQKLVGERDFDRLLFKNGLPWIMLFKGQDQRADDGTVVVCGDIGEAFGAEHVLFRNVRGLKELRQKEEIRKKLNTDVSLSSKAKDSLKALLNIWQPLQGGILTIPADPSFVLHDFYGNIMPSTSGKIIVPLNAQGYFLRTDGSNGSYERLVKALETASIKGYEPIEIIARDMTKRIEDKPELHLQLTNILNRTIKGKLAISLGDLQLSAPATVTLAAHQTLDVPVHIIGGKTSQGNSYPLCVRIDAGEDGQSVHYEDMHVNLIAHKKINVDGKLDDWQQALPQSVASKGTEGVSLTEAAWYPYKNFESNSGGYGNGYFAYDEKYFYLATKVADNTPNVGAYRFEQRPDDSFYYPDTAYVMDPHRTLITRENAVRVLSSDSWALETPATNTRNGNFWESGDNTNSFGIELDLPAKTYTRVALYLPNIKVNGVLLEIFDSVTGKLQLQRRVDNLWTGAYEVFDLSGKVRIVLHSNAWYYTAKLAGLFFDHSDAAKPAFVTEDLETKGNWKGKYGRSGFMVMGSAPYLPDGITVTKAKIEVKKPLIWPKGVRHYTYAKGPVTPDNSGLGYSFDNVLLGFNVIESGKDGLLDHTPGTMPKYTGYKCTDYEYALNPVAKQYGGGTEIWRLLKPGLNRKHFFPRQPKSAGEGPVKDGKLVIVREGNTLITECAIPWSELPDVKKALDAGLKIKISFRVNDDGAPGACMELAKDRSVSKVNSRAFHPDWKIHWANEVEFAFEK